MPRLLFLPGAGGRASFWQPAGELLPGEWERHYFSWPGLGIQPSDPAVQGLDDLIGLVIAKLDRPSDLIAQSMGALVALMVTLRAPEMVRRLVLTGPSSGVPVVDLGGADWRPDYRHEFPKASHWITEAGEDLSARLPSIQAPTLLLVGERDIISPLAVSEYLSGLLPASRVQIIAEGAHDFPETHAAEVAALIADHLS